MVGQLPYPAAFMLIQSSGLGATRHIEATSPPCPGCMCRVDPMSACVLHPCTCPYCKAGELRKCRWRRAAKEYLTAHEIPWAGGASHRVTYIQALEMINMEGVPCNAEERNMLNIVARLPMAQPLKSTLMILDLKAGIRRLRPMCNGTVPPMAVTPKGAVTSRMWSMRAGRVLTVSEMAKVMGHALDSADLRLTKETHMRSLLGKSMHVSTAGFAMAGLMASVGADTRSV